MSPLRSHIEDLVEMWIYELASLGNTEHFKKVEQK